MGNMFQKYDSLLSNLSSISRVIANWTITFDQLFSLVCKGGEGGGYVLLMFC